MRTIDPTEIEARAFYKYLTSSVAPRPIALVSSMDSNGNINLAPFSFFNMMGINPPILVFAPNKRSTDHSDKHTALNVFEVPEVVINLVDSKMVHQISLASADFERGINEFEKVGFTAIESHKVKPPRVLESPAQFECKVVDIVQRGTMVLVISEVIMAHFSETILDENGQIQQPKTDWVARLGGDWYLGGFQNQLFELPRPKVGIGFDNLPEHIRKSRILTGNDLGQLASVSSLPDVTAIQSYYQTTDIQDLKAQAAHGCAYLPDLLHARAHQLLVNEKVTEAWLVLLQLE